jgi:lipoic acid synthetase
MYCSSSLLTRNAIKGKVSSPKRETILDQEEEVYKAMDDLVENGLMILTLGQYLQPTKMHLEVAEFIHPDTFELYKEEGLKRGLKYVESGPLVRSSYHAERHVNVPL